MSSYGALLIGNLRVGYFRNWIPLEPILLFSEGDAVNEPAATEDADDFLGFRTTVQKARERMDIRGITFEFCSRFFNEFRSDFVHVVNTVDFSSKYVGNSFRFEDYQEFLKEALNKGGDALHSDEGGPSQDIFSEDTAHFDDALFFLQVRVLLEFAVPTRPVELNVYDLVSGGWLPGDSLPALFERWSKLLRRRVEMTYQLYGCVIEEDPRLLERLRLQLQALSEDALLRLAILPLLERMGFEGVRSVRFHGREEFGRDVLPFRQITPFGTIEYLAVQSKASDVHGTSSRRGNATEIISQAQQAFRVSFVDEVDNERKRIDKFIVVCSGNITPSARRHIEESFEGQRNLVLIDCHRLAELLREYRLHHYVILAGIEPSISSPRPSRLKTPRI